MDEDEERPEEAGRDEKAGALRAHPNKHTEAQLARTGGRKLFDRAAKEDFLGWYAASGNCRWAAEKAGFDDSTIWRHRLTDPEFAEALDRAAEQGIARAKVLLLEGKMNRRPYQFDGGRELPDFEIDPEIALRLIDQHERSKARGPAAPRQGRMPRVASNEEVDAALAKRLTAYAARVRAQSSAGEAAAGEGAPPPPFGRPPSPGNPGED